MKDSTKFIQDYIYELGKSMKFIVKKEYSFRLSDGLYTPRYDVVWFLDISEKVNSELITKYLGKENVWIEYFRLLPIAVFEIEGSTTSSKNQIGNLTNLYISPAYFNFIVVDNENAGNEKDTYRRGIKIIHSFTSIMGNRNVFFTDFDFYKNLTIKVEKEENTSIFNSQAQGRKGAGGETKSVAPSLRIQNDFLNSRLILKQDYEPQYFRWVYSQIESLQHATSEESPYDFILGKKNLWNPITKEVRQINKPGDYYYIPKIDMVYGFMLPKQFISFMVQLAYRVDEDSYNYPLLHYFNKSKKIDEEIFFPLLGFEVETSVNKHLNGGIINLCSYTFCGILVSRNEAEPYLNTYKNLFGIRNVFFRKI